MNAKEAREIVSKWGNVLSPKVDIPGGSFDQVLERVIEWAEAKGYLECLEGKEIENLVEALEFVHEAFEKVEDNELQGKYILNSHAFIVQKALQGITSQLKENRNEN